MDLDKFFQLKYELMERMKADQYSTDEEKAAYIKGYEKALDDFFRQGLPDVLEVSLKKAG
jgi:hypothetical protein